MYRLEALIAHSGQTTAAGHYVAYVRQNAQQFWRFDDHKANLIKSEDVLDETRSKAGAEGENFTAYLVVYKAIQA